MGNKKDMEEVRERAREAKRRRGGLLSVLVLLSVLLVSLLGCAGGTQTPTPVQGEVEGKLLEEESRQPLPGATVALAEYCSENEWVLRADLATTTDNEGNFVLGRVEPGSYLVVYDSTGEALADKKSWDRLKLLTGIQGAFLEGSEGVAVANPEHTQFRMTTQGGLVVCYGSCVLSPTTLVLEYRDCKPVQFRIEPDQVTEIEVTVWGL